MRKPLRLLSILLVLFLLVATVLPADAAKKKKKKSPPKPVPTNQLSIPSKERIVVFVADG